MGLAATQAAPRKTKRTCGAAELTQKDEMHMTGADGEAGRLKPWLIRRAGGSCTGLYRLLLRRESTCLPHNLQLGRVWGTLVHDATQGARGVHKCTRREGGGGSKGNGARRFETHGACNARETVRQTGREGGSE